MVRSAIEKDSEGRYKMTALPLLTGTEEMTDPDGKLVKYTREGNMRDMLIPLISLVGMTVRVLRGHELISPLAPKGGLRYDGK